VCVHSERFVNVNGREREEEEEKGIDRAIGESSLDLTNDYKDAKYSIDDTMTFISSDRYDTRTL
jgi:hypothetical protein